MKKYSDTIDDRWTGRHQASLEATGDLGGKTILDIGCGNGWFERGATGRGCRRVVGLSPGSEQLAGAQREVPEAFFIRAKLPGLPFRDGSFDLVVMWEVLEHLPRKSVEECLREVRGTIKPKGRLFLSTPRFDLRSTLTDPAWYFGHRHYTRKGLLAALARGGFRAIRVWSGGGLFEVVSMLLFYPCKWIAGREVPVKVFFEKVRLREYRKSEGWSTWFVEAEKIDEGS